MMRPKMTAEFKVWWVPQVPMKAFEVIVPSREEGKRLCDTLAKYDLFQFDNNIKPDFCNAGGVLFRHPTITNGEWWDIDNEDDWKSVEPEGNVSK